MRSLLYYRHRILPTRVRMHHASLDVALDVALDVCGRRVSVGWWTTPEEVVFRSRNDAPLKKRLSLHARDRRRSAWL